MEILESSFGITTSPALKKLCQILENHNQKMVYRCRHHAQSFVQIVTKIYDIKDFGTRIYVIDLIYKEHIKIINNAKFPDKIRDFLMNIVTKLYREKKKEWSKAKAKIIADRQREAQLLKNKQTK